MREASPLSDAAEGYTRTGPPPPSGVNATKGEGASITVTWTTGSEADYYRVWRCATPEGDYEILPGANEVYGGSHVDTTAGASVYYFYKVSSVNIVGESNLSDSGYGYHGSQPAPAPPTNLAATDRTHADRIVLTWDGGIGADSYTIYRAQWQKTGSGPWEIGPGAYTSIATGVTQTTYSDESSLQPGNYYYYITATNTSGTSAPSAVETGYRSVTDAEFVAIYQATEARLMEKITARFGSTPIGTATFPGDITARSTMHRPSAAQQAGSAYPMMSTASSTRPSTARPAPSSTSGACRARPQQP